MDEMLDLMKLDSSEYAHPAFWAPFSLASSEPCKKLQADRAKSVTGILGPMKQNHKGLSFYVKHRA
ncbi:hypothetical protein LMG28688_05817 [Paraburkholderia caffeinitolerans]|uniref:Uncharacterized protein n=1 Tax=Paraburkholderia caffeinitolerans TaxID=1723730 RepID=A0A6J5GMQ8_9BURK|nr:hypothetical protein [Paraburkholderia caffeinitolerans]CAB3803675.1 hypothetical protein LMG28688_05817 [Paraburkholderia caffeinitolerans]